MARRTKVSWKSRKSAWVRRDFPGLTGRVTALEVLPHQQYSPTCCMLSHSVVSDSATPWTVAHQAHLSMGFSRQEQWSGWLFPPSGDLPDPGIEPESLMSSHWQVGSSPRVPPGKPIFTHMNKAVSVSLEDQARAVWLTKEGKGLGWGMQVLPRSALMNGGGSGDALVLGFCPGVSLL